MPDPIEGSEKTDDVVITNPDEVSKLEDGDAPEEKDTPAVSSAASEKPADEAVDETEDPDSGETPEEEETVKDTDKPGDKPQALSDGGEQPKTPKPVPGETPKEYALRMEVERVKRANRQLRGVKLLGDVQPQKTVAPAELSDEEKKVLEGFDPEQVANQEKLFGILAKKHGYVRKDELTVGQYKETAQSVLDDWLEKHQEYSEDKDPDGILWKRFSEEFSMFRPPVNPKDHIKIFNRIHNDIFGITTKEKAEDGLKTVAAQVVKVNTAAAGAGGSTPRKLSDRRKATAADPELSKAARAGGLTGFSDAELAEMGL
jgi:hypothetical protein